MTSESFEPITIVGIDTDNIGKPRNDGTAGSALYRVPIKLSRTPSVEWARAFPEVWDRPPSWGATHRPGIGSVCGDTIILDGTTVEEVRDTHAQTLAAVVDRLNELEAQHVRDKAQRDRAAAEQQAAHDANVRKVAGEIRFGD